VGAVADMTETRERSAAEDWAEIEALFPAYAGMKPSMTWFNGVSSRLKVKRLSRLMSSSSAKKLVIYLNGCAPDRVKTLRTFAAVNLEQAMSAFRLTMIANVSGPILFLTVLHQLIDGGLGRLLSKIHQNDPGQILGMAIGAGVGSIFLLFVAFYALAHLNQARDIRHLIDVFAAERGIFFGLEDTEDLHSP